MKVKDLGTFRFSATPIKAVGAKASEKKLRSGYQYQCYIKSTKPTIAFCLRVPSLVVKEIVAFLPAELMIPYAKIAPILERISSCLSSIILLYSFLIVATFGS
jgi:hypothetical protein